MEKYSTSEEMLRALFPDIKKFPPKVVTKFISTPLHKLNDFLESEPFFKDKALKKQFDYDYDLYLKVKQIMDESRERLISNFPDRDRDNTLDKFQALLLTVHGITQILFKNMLPQKELSKKLLLACTEITLDAFAKFYEVQLEENLYNATNDIVKMKRKYEEHSIPEISQTQKVDGVYPSLLNRKRQDQINTWNEIATDMENEEGKVTIIGVARRLRLANSTFRYRMKKNETDFDENLLRFYLIEEKKLG